jgi:hypothetical protein
LITVHGWWKRRSLTKQQTTQKYEKHEKCENEEHECEVNDGGYQQQFTRTKSRHAQLASTAALMKMARGDGSSDGSDAAEFEEDDTSTFSEEGLLRSIMNERSRLRQGNVHRLLYEILDTAFDQLRPVTDAYRLRIDAVHDSLQKNEANFAKEHIKLVLVMKREILTLLREIRPMGAVLRHITEDTRLIGEQACRRPLTLPYSPPRCLGLRISRQVDPSYPYPSPGRRSSCSTPRTTWTRPSRSWRASPSRVGPGSSPSPCGHRPPIHHYHDPDIPLL